MGSGCRTHPVAGLAANSTTQGPPSGPQAWVGRARINLNLPLEGALRPRGPLRLGPGGPAPQGPAPHGPAPQVPAPQGPAPARFLKDSNWAPHLRDAASRETTVQPRRALGPPLADTAGAGAVARPPCRGHHGHLPRHARGVVPAPPGRGDAAPFLGRLQLPVCRRVRGPGRRLRQAGLRQQGARDHLCLGHPGDGDRQLSDVDILQPRPQFLRVFRHCVRHGDFFEHPQLGRPGLCAVRREPGGAVVGRRAPHPLRTHPRPQEGPSAQAAVEALAGGQLESERWRLRLGLACGGCFPG